MNAITHVDIKDKEVVSFQLCSHMLVYPRSSNILTRIMVLAGI